MTLRAALLSFLLAVVPAAPVFAQATSPAGSLTLISRPAGASFRISGDQEVVGRTPVTLDPWVAGRYRIDGSEIGYDRWSRSLVFDGMAADTLWMTLKRKNAFKAGGRALLLPGWGQFYDQHPKRGLVFLITGITAVVGVGVAQLRFSNRVDDAEAAKAAYLAAQTPANANAWQSAANEAGDAYDLRQVLIKVGAGIWGLSVIDAVAFMPRPVRPILLGAGPGGSGAARRELPVDGTRITMTLARVGF